MSMKLNIYPNIIIDFGSNTIKCGYNGESCPRLVIPNMIGRIKENFQSIFDDNNKLYIGNDAVINSPNLTTEYPLIKSKGKFKIEGEDYDYLESMFHYIFDKGLKVKQENYNIFIVDSLYTSTKEKAGIAKLLFEKLNIYNLHFEPQSLMTLYSTAKKSGLIIDSGENFTEIIPIYEEFIINNSLVNSNIAGQKMTELFLKYHKNEFDKNLVVSQYYFAQKLKEKFIEILPNGIENLNYENVKNEEFVLPDGNKILIGAERYEIPEVIFDPMLDSIDTKGVHEMVFESILNCDINIRKKLFENIILGGGNTLIKGFPERLKIEIDKLLDKKGLTKVNTKINGYPERKYSSWIGASGICSSSQFKDKWITKSMYSEMGSYALEQNY